MRLNESQRDYYTQKAKERNYPARSVFKLAEMDKKYSLVEEGDVILDLGCAPGSWLLYLSEKVGPSGKVVGVDFQKIKIEPRDNIILLKQDVLKVKPADLKKVCPVYRAVLSDLSPRLTGVFARDDAIMAECCQKAFSLAQALLSEGGNFVCKMFESDFNGEFFQAVKKRFNFAKRYRPKATPKRSREIYLVAKGYHRLAPIK